MHLRRSFAAAAAALGLSAFVGAAGAAESINIEKVRRDPHGRVTGVILEDGTELVGAVDNSQKLERVAVPGDPVRVTLDADDRMVLVNGRTYDTATIGDRARSVLRPNVSNPLGIGGGPVWAVDPDAARLDDASDLQRYFVVARVAHVLRSNAGAPSGLLMDDGTQVQVVPRMSGALNNIEPGQQLWVEGLGTRDEQGLSMWALLIKEGRYVHLDVERGDGAPEINVTGPFPEATPSSE